MDEKENYNLLKYLSNNTKNMRLAEIKIDFDIKI